VKKSDENLRALALNERVGENYSLTISASIISLRLGFRRKFLSVYLVSSPIKGILKIKIKKLRLPQCIMGDDLHIYDLTLSKMRG
jgi:hypothetical protein